MVRRNKSQISKRIRDHYNPKPEHYKASWSLPISLMRRFKDCQVFIETGTYVGGGVVQALECHFEKIYSIEIDVELFKHTKSVLSPLNHRIDLRLGDAKEILPQILSEINQRALIFLDAHWSEEDAPLVSELESINQHPIKDHVILIDDVNLIKKEKFGSIDFDNIERTILDINPNYHIEYIENKLGTDTILVAEV